MEGGPKTLEMAEIRLLEHAVIGPKFCDDYLRGNRADHRNLEIRLHGYRAGYFQYIRKFQPICKRSAAGGCSRPWSRRNSCSASTPSSSMSRSRLLRSNC